MATTLRHKLDVLKAIRTLDDGEHATHLSLTHAGAVLGVSASTVGRLVREGELVGLRGPGCLLIPVESVGRCALRRALRRKVRGS